MARSLSLDGIVRLFFATILVLEIKISIQHPHNLLLTHLPPTTQWNSRCPVKKNPFFSLQNSDSRKFLKTMHYKCAPLIRSQRVFTDSYPSLRLECTNTFHFFTIRRCEIRFDGLRKWVKIHLGEKLQKLCITNVSLKTASEGFFLKVSELWD